jgi:hypothetical protein
MTQVDGMNGTDAAFDEEIGRVGTQMLVVYSVSYVVR